MTLFHDCCSLRRHVAVSNIRWVERHMTSIRIAIASLLAAGTLLAGGAVAQHAAAARASHQTVVAGPVLCCADVMVN
jgi:hypothetical protein